MKHLTKAYFLFFLLTACWSAPSFAQVDTTITLKQLKDCVRDRYARSLEADLTALQYDNRGEWLKYLPNIGLTYTVSGQPRPAVSTSSSLFYQSRRDKKVRKSAKAAAIQRNQLEVDYELAQVGRLWTRFQSAASRAESYDEIATIDRDLFELYQKQYEAKEILPEAFLLKKKSFLLQELKRQEDSETLQLLWYEIIDVARCL